MSMISLGTSGSVWGAFGILHANEMASNDGPPIEAIYALGGALNVVGLLVMAAGIISYYKAGR